MKENQLDSEKIIIGDILNDLEAKNLLMIFCLMFLTFLILMTLFQLKIERYLSILKIN